MLIEQTGAGTLTILTLTSDVETWDVGPNDGIGWLKREDGSLDIFMRATLAARSVERDITEDQIVATFAQGGWQCVRWEAENGNDAEQRA
jgi:cold shock CspA family protein